MINQDVKMGVAIAIDPFFQGGMNQWITIHLQSREQQMAHNFTPPFQFGTIHEVN